MKKLTALFALALLSATPALACNSLFPQTTAMFTEAAQDLAQLKCPRLWNFRAEPEQKMKVFGEFLENADRAKILATAVRKYDRSAIVTEISAQQIEPGLVVSQGGAYFKVTSNGKTMNFSMNGGGNPFWCGEVR